MKHKIFLLLLLAIGACYGAGALQRKQVKQYKKKRQIVEAAAPAPEIFASVTQDAEFPGGDEALNKYLSANIRYPAAAREDGVEGIVTICFLIDTSGDVTRAFIQKDIGTGCGKEALRVIRKMPRWKPYKYNGRSIPYVATLTTRFRLKRWHILSLPLQYL
jgi:protein TonB